MFLVKLDNFLHTFTLIEHANKTTIPFPMCLAKLSEALFSCLIHFSEFICLHMPKQVVLILIDYDHPTRQTQARLRVLDHSCIRQLQSIE